MSIECITAVDYLNAQDKAQRNGADKPAFKRIQEDLKRLPKTQERLAFELLEIAGLALRRGKNPRNAALPALELCRSISEERLSDYIADVDSMAVQCFELMDHCRDNRFTFTFLTSLLVLRTLDTQRLNSLLEKLKTASEEHEPRRKLLAHAEESPLEIRKRIRKLRKQVDRQLVEYFLPPRFGRS